MLSTAIFSFIESLIIMVISIKRCGKGDIKSTIRKILKLC